MTRLRVVVVEDSITVRRRLCEVLESHPDFAIAGEADDGAHAIELCRKHRPDVVTMDMMLKSTSGLAAIEHIMSYCPTPILVVSSSFNRGELFKTYDALAAGAVDVLEKPLGDETDEAWERRFVSTVRMVARIRVITHPRCRLRDTGQPAVRPMESAPSSVRSPQHAAILALGASTGGPGALVEILRALPSGFPLPVLIALHINEPFGAAFAAWLDTQSCHRVAYARHGERIDAVGNRVVMAPPDRHLVVHDGGLRLTTDPERHSCRPSVDVMFSSIAREFGPRSIACLLTGMGRDGAAGLLEIRNAGGMTIAQDEPTSVVYGMPREAAILGAASQVLPLGQIGPVLAALVAEQGVRT